MSFFFPSSCKVFLFIEDFYDEMEWRWLSSPSFDLKKESKWHRFIVREGDAVLVLMDLTVQDEQSGSLPMLCTS